MRGWCCGAFGATRRALIRTPRGASICATGGPLIGLEPAAWARATIAGLSRPFIGAAFKRHTFARRAFTDWPSGTALAGAFRSARAIGNAVVFSGAAGTLGFAL